MNLTLVSRTFTTSYNLNLSSSLPFANRTELYTTSTTFGRPFSDTDIVITASLLIFFLIFGLIGNGLTIAVIVHNHCLRSNVFMRFILSLCVSDLISALISWIFLYRRTWGFDVWSPIPNFLCTFYWAADIMTTYVTASHILSFAVLRLISIKAPILYGKINVIHGNIWIGLIWILCFLCGFIPSLTIFGPGIRNPINNSPNSRWPVCTILQHRIKEYRIFQTVTFPMFLYIPTIGVVVISFVIMIIVKMKLKKAIITNKQEKQQKKEKQAVLQLVLIIFAFLIGYIPFTAYEFWSAQELPAEEYYFWADYWFGMIEYLFLRFSECLNPIFYNLGSAKLRKYTKNFLKEKLRFSNICCSIQCNRDHSSSPEEERTSTNRMTPNTVSTPSDYNV